MKNILIVTIGNSDVQVKGDVTGTGFQIDNQQRSSAFVLKKEGLEPIEVVKNRNYEHYLIAKPRLNGEKIAQHFQVYRPTLDFPIILPVIEQLLADQIQLAEIWLVYTNQADEKQRLNDTLFFKDIIKTEIQNRHPGIKTVDYEITDDVTNIDYQYKDFLKKGKEIIRQQHEINKIYLLPQGGIDQINTALTLQFIQLFKDKLVLYQKAENTQARQMNFPQLFLEDLTREKIIEHIKNYDFRLAVELMLANEGNYKSIKKLCKYAADRLELLHDGNAGSIFSFNDIKEEGDLERVFVNRLKLKYKELSVSEQHAVKLADVIYQCKICFLVQKDYNKGLVLFFTLIENLIKVELEKLYSPRYDLYKYRKEDKKWLERLSWEGFIEEIDPALFDYIKTVKLQHGSPLNLSSPNRLTYFYLYSFLLSNDKIPQKIQPDEFDRFFNFCEKMAGNRNGLAHNLKGVSESDLNSLLKKFNYTLKTMFDPIDQIAGTSGFGIYQEIQHKVLEILDKN